MIYKQNIVKLKLPTSTTRCSTYTFLLQLLPKHNLLAYFLISGFFLLIPAQLLTSKHHDSS